MSGVKEGLVAIANEVLEDLKKESEVLIRESERDAKEKLEKAKTEAKSVYNKVVESANEKIIADQRRAKATTEVEVRNSLLQVKESLVDDVFEGAKEELRKFVLTAEYYPRLLGLIQEGVGKISAKSVVIFVNLKDKAWLVDGNLERLSKKMRVGLALSDDVKEYIGGCRVQSVDGKMGFDNTLDARLELAKESVRGEVAKILFELEK
jgi:V/A-type H+-transporting ATPase subunit E